MNKKLRIALMIASLIVSGMLTVNYTDNTFNDTSAEADRPLTNFEAINYIKTLVGTEIFDADHQAIGMMGENQTLAVEATPNNQLLKLTDLPFFVDYQQIEIVTEPQTTKAIDLDLSRYLAFEQMIAKGSAVSFYHLDHTFAFSLKAIDANINIYMEEANHFYVSYMDTYFLVAADQVTLTPNPHALSEATHIPVLMYHFFCNSAEGLECKDGNWLERDHFKEHMRYLREHNFTSLKMIDLERFLKGNVRLPEQSVVITLDDAHWSMLEHAYPILVETNQIATTFAITHQALDWETLMLSEHLEFHSHSHDLHRGHCDTGRGGLMQCIDFDKGVADLKRSRALLNDSTVFCYPFGDYNDHGIAMLQEAGFTLAFTTENGLVTRNSEPLLLPRVRISTTTYLPQFIYLVNQ